MAARNHHFNPRFPWGKRRRWIMFSGRSKVNFNPRFPWGKRQKRMGCWIIFGKISIHASRGGSDLVLREIEKLEQEISIHASRGGSDRRQMGSC